MFTRNYVYIFIILTISLAVFFVGALNAHEEDAEAVSEGRVGAYSAVYNAAQSDLILAWKDLDKLEIEYAMLQVQWNANNKKMTKNAIALVKGIKLDVLEAISDAIDEASKQIENLDTAYKLFVARAEKAREISVQNMSVQSAIDKRDKAHADYTKFYNLHSATYYYTTLPYIQKGKTPALLSTDGVSVPCGNPFCSTVYTVGNVHPSDSTKEISLDNVVALSGGHHLETCNDSPTCYMRNYWNCPNIPQLSCPISRLHWRLCPGTCQKKFAPVAFPHPGGNGDVIYVSNFPHETNCNKRVAKTLKNPLGNCPGKYYSCAGVNTCTNANNHINGTKPSPPASFSLTAGSHSIRLSWTNSPSDGGSDITAYEYQYRCTGNIRKRWGSWSGWSSAGMRKTYIITGLKPYVACQVRMRARNSVGPSSATDAAFVVTRSRSGSWER